MVKKYYCIKRWAKSHLKKQITVLTCTTRNRYAADHNQRSGGQRSGFQLPGKQTWIQDDLVAILYRIFDFILVIKSECNFFASKLHYSNKHNLRKHSTGNCIYHICSLNTVWNQRNETNVIILWFFFFDHIFLYLPTYESYILHNHKIIFTVFSQVLCGVLERNLT